jgi:hypothetical protein
MTSSGLLLATAVLLALPAFTFGAEACFTPSLAVAEQYNDNILLNPSTNTPVKDYITVVSPALEMSKKTDRLDSSALLKLDGYRYSRHEQYDALDQYVRGNARYSYTERLIVAGEAGYRKDENPSIHTPMATSTPGPTGPPGPPGPPAPPPPAVTPSAQAVQLTITPVERAWSSASMDYKLSELTWLTASYRFVWNSYQKPQYRDQSHDVQAGFTADVGNHIPRTKAMFNTGYSQYLLPNSRTVNIMATAGLSHEVNETLSVLLDGGARFTDAEATVNVPILSPLPIFEQQQSERTDWGGVFHTTVKYKTPLTSAELFLAQDFAMAYLATGQQVPSERRTVAVTGRYQFAGKMSSSLTAGYGRYETARDFSQRQYNISPLLRYDLTKELALEAFYERLRIEYATTAPAHRDMYFIRLTSRWPFCSSNQYK